MADESQMARRAERMTGVAHMAVGYVLGRVVQRVAVNIIDPAPPGTTPETLVGGGTSRMDDLAVIGGAGFAGYKAVKGGKYKNIYAGAAVGMASPLLDRIVDRVTETLGGFMAGAGAGAGGG